MCNSRPSAASSRDASRTPRPHKHAVATAAMLHPIYTCHLSVLASRCTRLPFSAARDSAAVTGASKRCRRKAAAGATALLSTRYGARRGAVARACDARCMRGRVYTRCAVYMCPCDMHASMLTTYTHLCTRHAHTRVQHSCSSSLCLPLLCDQHPGRRCAAGAAGLQHAWNGRVRAAAARVAAHAVC